MASCSSAGCAIRISTIMHQSIRMTRTLRLWVRTRAVSRAWSSLSGATAALSILTTGCVWHGREADHVLGPALIRAQPATDAAGPITQTTHFPLLFEGGKQWGASAGWMQRLVVTATMPGGEHAAAASHWSPSFIYRRLPRPAGEAEFLRRANAGFWVLAGRELWATGLGWSSRNETWPVRDGVHTLHINTTRPLSARFTVTPGEPETETVRRPITTAHPQ